MGELFYRLPDPLPHWWTKREWECYFSSPLQFVQEQGSLLRRLTGDPSCGESLEVYVAYERISKELFLEKN